MIVQLVAVDMMNVKIDSPSLASFAAMLARPFVAVLDFLTNAFPVWRVIPFGYASLPGGIIGAANRAAGYQGFRERSPFNSSLCHDFDNGGLTDGKLFGNLCDRTQIVNVLAAQPVGIVIERLWAIVTGHIFLPLTVLAYPVNGCTATASTKWGGSLRLIRGFAGSMFSGFGLSASGELVQFEKIANVWRRASKRICDFLVRRVEAVGLASPVVIADRQFLFLSE